MCTLENYSFLYLNLIRSPRMLCVKVRKLQGPRDHTPISVTTSATKAVLNESHVDNTIARAWAGVANGHMWHYSHFIDRVRLPWSARWRCNVVCWAASFVLLCPEVRALAYKFCPRPFVVAARVWCVSCTPPDVGVVSWSASATRGCAPFGVTSKCPCSTAVLHQFTFFSISRSGAAVHTVAS